MSNKEHITAIKAFNELAEIVSEGTGEVYMAMERLRQSLNDMSPMPSGLLTPKINGNVATVADGEVETVLTIDQLDATTTQVIIKSDMCDETIGYEFIYLKISDLLNMINAGGE